MYHIIQTGHTVIYVSWYILSHDTALFLSRHVMMTWATYGIMTLYCFNPNIIIFLCDINSVICKLWMTYILWMTSPDKSYRDLCNTTYLALWNYMFSPHHVTFVSRYVLYHCCIISLMITTYCDLDRVMHIVPWCMMSPYYDVAYVL